MQTINRQIIRLAWPAIITNITAPLMALVDTAVVGHLGDSAYIAGTALGGAVFNLVYWLLGFLRTGTSGLVGQAVGKGEQTQAISLLRRMGLIALIAGMAIIILSGTLFDGVMRFMDADDSAQAPGRIYFFAAVWGAPAYLMTSVLSGWFVGEQDTRPILIMALVSNILNAILSPLLAFVAGLAVQGIAIATAIAQWVGVATGLIMLLNVARQKKISLTEPADARIPWIRLLHINTDIFLRTLCLVAVTLWFTRAGARISTEVLAANAVLMQLFMLFSFFTDGFAFAGEALAAKSFGAGDYRVLRATVRSLMHFGMILAVVFTVIYFLCGEGLVSLLTDNLIVRENASETILWVVAIPLCGFMAFTWDGIFIGMTLTGRMLISMIIAMAVFFGSYFRLTPDLGVHGLWLAFILYLSTRGIAQYLLFRTYMRNLAEVSK